MSAMNQVAGRIGIIGLFVGLVACAGPGAPSATISPSGDQSVEPSASAEGSDTGSPDPATAPIFQNWALATIA
ncbi:MAG: hypothetical protein ABJC24_06795 [Chloroflexota bacterium]